MISRRKRGFTSMRRHLYAIQHWLWFGLILSFIPLLCTVWLLYEPNTQVSSIIKKVTSHGEVLLICLSTLGAGMGELYKNTKKRIFIKPTLVGASLCLSLFCIFAYASVYNGTNMNISLENLSTSENVLFATIALSVSILIVTTKGNE